MALLVSFPLAFCVSLSLSLLGLSIELCLGVHDVLCILELALDAVVDGLELCHPLHLQIPRPPIHVKPRRRRSCVTSDHMERRIQQRSVCVDGIHCRRSSSSLLLCRTEDRVDVPLSLGGGWRGGGGEDWPGDGGGGGRGLLLLLLCLGKRRDKVHLLSALPRQPCFQQGIHLCQ